MLVLILYHRIAQPSLEARWQNLEARVSALEARDAMQM